MTWEVSANMDVRYEVRESVDLLDPANPTLSRLPGGGTSRGLRLVVVDRNVHHLYGNRIIAYFASTGIPISLVVIEGDEYNKTMGQVLRVMSALDDIGTKRISDPPIAIGGGVLLDVVGLAASLYRRGIPHIRVPTTLLSLVDTSVAAKTGVNFQGYRNRIGSYSPAPVTLIDPSFLATVPSRQISNGAGEILKLALIKDAELFEILEAEGPRLIDDSFQGPGAARSAIRRAIAGMIDELRGNLWEKDLERVVDYGHSFSPLVEMTYVTELLHGEAVTLDCLFSAVLAAGRGYLGEDDLLRAVLTAQRLNLPTWHRGFGDVALLQRALADTVLHRDGRQNLPLMTGIGRSTFVNDVTADEIALAAAHLERLSERTTPRVEV
ncbi:sedoheptulose 7-phosphate cyclase [Umezawaea sp. NPDC059074]|uniref:sedoheptulose 7-phosphate cyclase n=1 Tax=Umezawaea sp. NPDC059074 TaxID=3346716 RepID=UPI00367EDCE9